MALTISQLVNDYGSYSGKTLVGELGSRATVPGGGFGGVRGVPYDNITFIVKVNGTRYASSRWLSQQQNGNPYIHSTSVARIDTRDIGLMPIDKSPFANREDEKYAEVRAKSKLGESDDEILKFINYLLDGKDGTDPAIPTFGSFDVHDNKDPEGSLNQTIQNPGNGEEYEVSPIRVFDSKTPSRSKKSWLGSYSSENDLAGIYPGLGFAQTNFDGTLSGPDAQSQSIPAIPSEEVKEVVDLGEDFQIDLSDFTFDPIDFELDPIDFGFGDINTNFGFGLGGDVSVGGTNQFTSVNYAGDDFTTRASTAYSGFVTDANDFNEPEVFGGFGSFG
jgi:hypothetical protein